MKRIRWYWILLIVLLVLVLALGIGLWSLFGTFLKAAGSIEKVEDGLYSMEYVGDYGFNEFLKQSGATSDQEVANYLISYLSKGFYKIDTTVSTGEFGCSTLCLKDEGGKTIFGRNYDWEESSAMIIHTKPTDGYESISTCCLEFLGFGDGYEPTASMPNRFMAIAAIYVPLDGMNEKGLMVADLIAGDKEATHQKRGKTSLTTTTAIRLLLDHAATVDEALELLSEYDMYSSIGSAHHFSIADKSGRSVVVEYVDGEMLVKDTKVVTNFMLTDSYKKDLGSEQSHLRYEKLMALSSPMTEEGMRDALSSVAQYNYPQDDGSYELTVWSLVYVPAEGRSTFYFKEDFDKGYILQLGEKEFLRKTM